MVVLNPYQRHIILTKSFKKTATLRQTLKLAYNLLFASCACQESCSRVEFGRATREEKQLSPIHSNPELPQMTKVSTRFARPQENQSSLCSVNHDKSIFAQTTPVQPRTTFDPTTVESLGAVARNLNLQFRKSRIESPFILSKLLNFNFGSIATNN
jgi:hypothetical protein